MDDTSIEREYYKNGQIKIEKWYKQDKLSDFKKLNREDGPAYVEYYPNGQIKEERWCQGNKLNREGAPAWIEYYENGQIKTEKWYKSDSWYIIDKLHREDGPSWIEYDENGQIKYEGYHLNGERVEKGDLLCFKEQVDKLKKMVDQKNQKKKIGL